MSKITPFLWFDNQAEDAIKFYCSVFKNAKVLSESRMPNGALMTATFELDGQQFMALNAGPQFKFNEAVSFLVSCKTQDEVDYYWNKLTEGGEEQPCGWLKDKYGLSWQIIPDALGQLLNDPDPVKAQNVMQAMLQMKKIEIDKLERASELA